MAIFDFDTPTTGNALGSGSFGTFSDSFTFTSQVSGAGLFGDSMTFTVSVSASTGFSFVRAGIDDANDQLDITMSSGNTPSLNTVSIRFDDGGTKTALDGAVADFATGGGINAFWITAGGSIAAANGVTVTGPVFGMRFVMTGGAGSASINSITGTPVCFAVGTAIATPAGATAVQDLAIGDEILSAAGAVLAVKWIGRQTVDTRFAPAERLTLVRIGAGALGGGLPLRDLTVTADHAMLLDGVLVNAGALVNGADIDHVPAAEAGEHYTVYHVETEGHEIILAEGAASETFVDYATRRRFDNYAEFVALYGDGDRAIRELTYPRVSSPRMRPGARRAA